MTHGSRASARACAAGLRSFSGAAAARSTPSSSRCALLEDDPLFNAGTGATLTAAGDVELDASIMDGETLRCGAVAVVRDVRNPVALARGDHGADRARAARRPRRVGVRARGGVPGPRQRAPRHAARSARAGRRRARARPATQDRDRRRRRARRPRPPRRGDLDRRDVDEAPRARRRHAARRVRHLRRRRARGGLLHRPRRADHPAHPRAARGRPRRRGTLRDGRRARGGRCCSAAASAATAGSSWSGRRARSGSPTTRRR